MLTQRDKHRRRLRYSQWQFLLAPLLRHSAATGSERFGPEKLTWRGLAPELLVYLSRAFTKENYEQ